MAQTIEIGTLVMKADTNLPEHLQIKSDRYMKGWNVVKSSEMDRKLSAVGWTYFYMAGEVQGMAIGPDSEGTTRRAVKQAIANMKSDRFNCLEISGVVRKKGFLGLPCTTVTGHARHIQDSLYLFHQRHISEWDQAKLAAIGSEVQV